MGLEIKSEPVAIDQVAFGQTAIDRAAIDRALALKLLPDKANPFPFERRWRLARAVAVLAVMLPAFVSRWLVPSWIPAIAVVVLCVVGTGFYYFRRRHVLQVLTAARGLLCPNCHYDLSALEPSGQCPECASAYTFEQVRRIWTNTYALWKKVSAFRDGPSEHARLQKWVESRGKTD